MKVLLLHQHFKTPTEGGALRSYYLAKALVDRGIETVVITGRTQLEYQYSVIDGIQVHYLPVPYENSYGFWSRSKGFISYVYKTVQLAGKVKGVSRCYAISVPLTVGIAAILIRKFYHLPFLFEVGDLWPDAPIELGFIRNTWFKNALYLLEKKIYREAEIIVALSPAIQSSIQSKVPGADVRLIPNMSDTEYFGPEMKTVSLEQKYHVENKFVISYLGAAGFANGLEYFIECARISKRDNLPIHFMLCGEGAKLNELVDLATKLELNNITFTGLINRAGIREVLNITDASFVCYRPAKILTTGSPNKYFDALASGKLVVINFGGWIEDEITKYQCGVRLGQDVGRDLVKQIVPFISNPSLLRKYQEAARQLAEMSFPGGDWESVCRAVRVPDVVTA